MTRNAFTLDSFTMHYSHGGGTTMGPWTCSLEQGRAGVLCGPSGCGKTTLLHCLAGLDANAFGPLEITGQCHVTSPAVDLLFEKPFLQLLGPLVRDELNAAEESSWLSSKTRKQEREWLLESFCLDSLWDRPVRDLSEGERQKLALACLFLRSPALLLLDQPASSLDLSGQAALRQAIDRAAGRGASVLLADPDWRRVGPLDAERLSLFPKASALPKAVLEGRLFEGPGWGGGRGPGCGETILAFEGLDIRRGGRTILRDISGQVSRGEVIALVGDNGSGKTSLLLTIAGLLKPGRGRLARPCRQKRRLRWARPGLMLQESLWHLSGKPVKRELAWAGKGSSRQRGVLPETLASLLDLGPLLERPGLLLSRGEMQRVALAMALLRDAPLVCLDEPVRFLWDQEKKTIGRIFQAARDAGLSLLVASPLEETLPWADQVWRLTRGRMEICRNSNGCDNSATQSSSAPSGAP